MRAWLERHPTLAAFLAGLVTAAALPPLYLLPALAGFGVLIAILHRARPGPGLHPRHRFRLRLLPGRALLGRDRLLRRCRAVRRLRRPGRAGPGPLPGAHGGPRRRSGGLAPLAIAGGAGAGLRRRLDPGRALARRTRPAVPLEPDRLGLGGERRVAPDGGLHRHLRAEPAHGRRGWPDRTPVHDRPDPAARGGGGAGAVRLRRPGRWVRCASRWHRPFRIPAFSSASSRPMWRSTTNGIPRSG